jgi:transposase
VGPARDFDANAPAAFVGRAGGHQIVKKQIREIEQTRLEHLAQAPAKGTNAMVLLLARVVGIGVETADMLVQEVLSRHMRDRRAVARYAGLTGSPDESGAKRREKGLARSGNARPARHDSSGLAVPMAAEGQ